MIFFGETHLQRSIDQFLEYYHEGLTPRAMSWCETSIGVLTLVRTCDYLVVLNVINPTTLFFGNGWNSQLLRETIRRI